MWRRRGARPALGLVGAAAVAAGCARGAPGSGSPEAVVRTFLERVARHDIEVTLTLLDDDFVLRSSSGGFTARAWAMPAMMAWDAAADGDPRIDRLEADGDTVRVELVEQNLFGRRLGLAPWTVEATFTVRDGRIVEEVVHELVGDDEPPFHIRFTRALEPVRRWAVEADPEAAEAVFEEERVARYDGRTARRLLALIDDYCRAVEAPALPCTGAQRLPGAEPQP